jgi:hypothetical protein
LSAANVITVNVSRTIIRVFITYLTILSFSFCPCTEIAVHLVARVASVVLLPTDRHADFAVANLLKSVARFTGHLLRLGFGWWRR